MRLGAQPFLWKRVVFAWFAMISISKPKHLPSFWNRGPGELGYGRFGFRMICNYADIARLLSFSAYNILLDRQNSSRLLQPHSVTAKYPTLIMKLGYYANVKRETPLPLHATLNAPGIEATRTSAPWNFSSGESLSCRIFVSWIITQMSKWSFATCHVNR